MTAHPQELEFQAETKHLLDLVVHSLYTSKDIFLRELISNASDALDRLRFESLTNPELLGSDSKFEIRLEPDEQGRTLTISDNGIGMSRDEVIANIGTIAKSGTRELRERINKGDSPQALAEFIGQFGVGFYSCFMVADKVTLVTRRAGEETATRWESTGAGLYSISDDDRPDRGTSITLHLKPIDAEGDIDDYCDYWVLSRIVRRYSDFVSYPIICKEQRHEVDGSNQVTAENAKPTLVIEDKILNSMKPIWTRAQSEVSREEYNDFYRHIAHDWSEPFHELSLKAEGTMEYQALLFIPAQAPDDLYYHRAQCGLRLYAKRVMIVEQCEDLLPRYLRFIKGVVDSADLPLNISRQMLQQDRHTHQIRKWITKKVLDALAEMKEREPQRFLSFWEQFGRALKEGVSTDYDNRDKLLSLLLFQSSNHPTKLTTLSEYLSRMKKPAQNEVFYLTGETRSLVESSPHLEAFKAKDYEVLYLTEPVDELVVRSLMDFEGKRLRSVGQGTVSLGNEEERKQAEESLRAKEEEARNLLTFIQKHLDRDVKQVRLSSRLVESPVCLVGTEIDYSPQMERLLQKGKGGGPKQRRIMEINPKHEIFEKMLERYNIDHHDAFLGDYAELLLGYGLLAEGSELPDPARFNKLIVEVMASNIRTTR